MDYAKIKAFSEETDIQTPIIDVFSENKFNLFVTYCEKRGFRYISDLKGFDFDTLQDVDHIGVGKIREIKERYKMLVKDDVDEVANTDLENTFDSSISQIHNELEWLGIDFLYALGLKSKAINNLSSLGYKTIGSLKGVPFSKLKIRMTAGAFDTLMAIKDTLTKPLNDIIEESLLDLESDKGFTITLLRAKGYTLQAIGESYKVTRERIRQIVSKFEKKISPMMEPFQRKYIKEKGYISGSDIMDYFEDSRLNMIILLWLKDCKELEYLDFADVFVPLYGEKEHHRQRILSIATEFIGDGIDLSENLDDLENLMFKNGYPFVDEAAFLNLVQSERYYIYRDYVIKGKQSYGFLCSRVVEKEFPDGIKLYDSGSDDLDLLRKLTRRMYGDIGISEDNRAFSSRLADFLILCDKGKVTAKENIRVDMAVIRKIKTYIDQSNEREMYYSALFDLFRSELTASGNINNHYFLHGILKLYYDEEFDFSNRDYFTKSGKGLSSGRTDDKILQVIENANSPVGKLVLKKKVPGLSDAMLSNAVMYNEKLIPWEPNYYYSMSLVSITDDDKEFLARTIRDLMAQYRGYCSEELLFEEVSAKRADFIRKNHMNDADNLFYVCANLFSSIFEFRKPHITRLDSFETISAQSIVIHLLKDPVELSYSQYRNLAKELKWSDVTTSMVFVDIEKDYVRVTEDLYVRKEEYSINPLEIERITLALMQLLQNEFISISEFDKWDMLPYVGYDWNPFLLRSIVDIYIPSLRVIDMRKKHRSYERGIIVDAESIFVDYVDIVAFLIRQKNIKEIEESDLCSLLIDKGVASNIIPKEVYVSDKIEYDEGLFKLKV